MSELVSVLIMGGSDDLFSRSLLFYRYSNDINDFLSIQKSFLRNLILLLQKLINHKLRKHISSNNRQSFGIGVLQLAFAE